MIAIGIVAALMRGVHWRTSTGRSTSGHDDRTASCPHAERPRPVVIIKLGGSAVTEKARREVRRPAQLWRTTAEQIAVARERWNNQGVDVIVCLIVSLLVCLLFGRSRVIAGRAWSRLIRSFRRSRVRCEHRREPRRFAASRNRLQQDAKIRHAAQQRSAGSIDRRRAAGCGHLRVPALRVQRRLEAGSSWPSLGDGRSGNVEEAVSCRMPYTNVSCRMCVHIECKSGQANLVKVFLACHVSCCMLCATSGDDRPGTYEEVAAAVPRRCCAYRHGRMHDPER